MKSNDRKKITIYDVAKHAGVAPGTVSRTINNIGYIKSETRKKVMESVGALGYIPNMAGRTLKTTKTGLICLAIPDTSNAIYFRMIESVLEVAKQHSYSMVLYYTNGLEEEELKVIRILQESIVDGLFMVHFSYSNRLRTAIDSCMQPIVLCGMCDNLWAGQEERNFDTVSINVSKGIYQSTSFLIDHGHKDIVYLAGKKGIEVYSQRYEAFRRALFDHKMQFSEDCVFWHGYDEEAGYLAGMHFIYKHHIPTAVCASNDLQAIGFYKAMKEHKIKMPEIVGMDNLEMTDILGISSMNMFEAEMGRRAAELVFLRMKDPFVELPPQDEMFVPELIDRSEQSGWI